MDEEIKDITPDTTEPIEVRVKEKETPPQPDFDYDDYTPTDSEILEIETEIAQKIKERTKNG